MVENVNKIYFTSEQAKFNQQFEKEPEPLSYYWKRYLEA